MPNTISMKSVLATSYPIHFNLELNKVLGFTNKENQAGTHTSEKKVMISSTDKVQLKCDCVDDLIVNGIREQVLFSFNLSAPPGYKILKEPTTVLFEKINKTRLDTIQFFLEDSNHNRVDFNGETITFAIQIIKIYYLLMSYNKYKNTSYFVGGKHYSATTNIHGDITVNKKTGLPVK